MLILHKQSYLEFEAILILFHCVTFLALHSFDWYVSGLGFAALGLEATLPIPQLVANFQRKSTAGFRYTVLLGFVLGDFTKTVCSSIVSSSPHSRSCSTAQTFSQKMEIRSNSRSVERSFAVSLRI